MKIQLSFNGTEIEIVIGTKGLIAILGLGILCRLDTVLAAIETIIKWVSQ